MLAIGAARYVFLAAGWPLQWMRAPLPPRYWRKVVAATQGIVLTVAAAGVLPPARDDGALSSSPSSCLRSRSAATSGGCGATGRHASADGNRAGAHAGPGRPSPDARPDARANGHRRGAHDPRRSLVWVVLVAPDQPQYLTLSGFLRLPLEGLVLIALAVVLPPTRPTRPGCGRRTGPHLVVALKVINYGFFKTFNRPFDPIGDTTQLGNGLETMRSLVGRTETNLIEVGVVAGLVVLVVLLTLAVLRLTRVAAANRRWTLRAVAGLGAVWALCWVFGAQLISHTPIASTLTAGLIVDEVHALQADIHDRGVFAKQINSDASATRPTNQLLTGLRGKDVLLVFVEAYGQQAVQGTSFSPEVDAALAQGTSGCRAPASRPAPAS